MKQLGSFGEFWGNLPFWIREGEFLSPPESSQVEACTKALKGAGITTLIQIGMGGSIGAARLFSSFLPRKRRRFAPICLDTLHPRALEKLAEQYPPRTTAYLVASKSGKTLEVLILLTWLKERVFSGDHKALKERLFILTDPGSPLAFNEVSGEGLRAFYFPRTTPEEFRLRIFYTPAPVGGRYSAFTSLGLTLYALSGGDVPPLIHSVRSALESFQQQGKPFPFFGTLERMAETSPSFFWAFYLPRRLDPFGLWVEQLLAESLGKKGRGVIPVLLPEGKGFWKRSPRLPVFSLRYELKGTSRSRTSRAHRTLGTVSEVSCEIFRYFMTTILLAQTLGVDPFDQPDVEATKAQLHKLLTPLQKGDPPSPLPGLRGEEDKLQVLDPLPLARRAHSSPPLYVAILAYLEESPSLARSLRALEEIFPFPVLLQYGPRYLHSTGQLFKGGPRRALFFLLTETPSLDPHLQLPFLKGRISLATFLYLQARADYQALKAARQRVVHVHFPSGWRKGWEPFLELCRNCQIQL